MRANAFRTFRIVAGEDKIPAVIDLLRADGLESDPLAISPFCRVSTRESMPLGSSLAAFFGYIYIQDKSSMLPPLALAPDSGAPVLDLCASPGGKSAFLGQLTGSSGFVLANEPPGARLGTLRANILRASLPQVASCAHDGRKIPLAENSWPHILLDAPCSGWGTVEKNPQAPKIWQGKKIRPLIVLQRALLQKAASLLAPGGSLVYSTCTTNIEENEDQVRFALDHCDLELEPLRAFPDFHFEEILPGALRVNGPASGAQGFFVARLCKPKNAADLDKARANAQDWASDSNPTARAAGDSDPSANNRSAPPNNFAISSNTGQLVLPENGRAQIFGGTTRFLPGPSQIIPAGFAWQGYPLGKETLDGFLPQARLHAFLPPKGQDLPLLALDSAAEIRALLSGCAMQTGLGGHFAALYYRDLPLGFIGLKKGRPIPAFR